MLEELFFILGIANSILLICIFLIRKKMNVLQRVGKFYFLLAIPAIYGIFLVQQEHKTDHEHTGYQSRFPRKQWKPMAADCCT